MIGARRVRAGVHPWIFAGGHEENRARQSTLAHQCDAFGSGCSLQLVIRHHGIKWACRHARQCAGTVVCLDDFTPGEGFLQRTSIQKPEIRIVLKHQESVRVNHELPPLR